MSEDRLRSRRRAAVVFGILLLLPVAVAEAASAAKKCTKSCKQALGTCKRSAVAQQRAAIARCPKRGTEARRCRQQQKGIGKDAKRTCGGFLARCKQCCTAGGAACSTPPELPVVSGAFVLPDRGALSHTGLPPAPDGRGFVALPLPDGILTFDPAARTPVSAAAECAAVMLACFEPPVRNWAGCFAAVPKCTSATPWVGDAPMCCAAACADRYQALLADGLRGPEAFAAAIWEDPSCMPGFAGRPPRRRRP